MEGLTFSIIILLLGLVTVNSGNNLYFSRITPKVSPIADGASTCFFCIIPNAENYSISWYRETPAGIRKAIYRDGRLINNDLGREAQAYSLPGVHLFPGLNSHCTNSDVRIENVGGLGRLLNGNNYTCEVTEKDTGKVVLVSSGLILEAYYSPSHLYPICKACGFSSEFIGSYVTISCYSEFGYPPVQLQWSRNGKAIENLTITNFSYIYLNYTFILEAGDLDSTFSCSNGIQSCNITTDQASAEECSPINFDAPESTDMVWTDKDEEKNSSTMLLDVETSMCQSPTTIIVLSVFIAVFITTVSIETAVNIYLFRKLQQCKKATKGVVTTALAPDYINVQQSNDNRSLETYSDLMPRDEANYTSLQNPQHKDIEGLEMMITVPDSDYINIKQSTANRKI